MSKIDDLRLQERATIEQRDSALQRAKEFGHRSRLAQDTVVAASRRLEQIRQEIEAAENAQTRCSFVNEQEEPCTSPATWTVEWPKRGAPGVGRLVFVLEVPDKNATRSCDEHLYLMVGDPTGPALVSPIKEAK